MLLLSAGLFPGFWEMMIVLAVVLLIFGPRNLPKLGAMIGKTIGSFRDAATKGVDEDEETPKAPASIDSRKEPR